MLDIKTLKQLFADKKETLLKDYFTFLRFQSIATDPHFKTETLACADWLIKYLEEAGLHVDVWETDNAPVLFATDLRAGPEKETLLIYCHYDVQPVDPLEEWINPPFEPTIREGQVYARGAADNKGQCFYTITAIKTLLEQLPSLSINLKFLIEGEEESGSTSLAHLLEEKKELLAADHLVIVDSGMHSLDQPAITLGVRGMVCMDVTVQEASFDLHSGMAGGIAYNPNRALVEMLYSLHDAKGHIPIPGFYEAIVDLTDDEKKAIDFSFNTAAFTSLFGFEPSSMENGVSPLEASWIRPTVEINGITGGYGGPGFKTVIPAKASAKISCRLVPNQSPEQITALVSEFLIKKTPKGLKTTVKVLPGNGRAFRTDPHARIVNIMSESYAEVFQMPCKKILMGGSIPIAAELQRVSNAEVVLVGLGLPGDRVHAPNEHFGFDRIELGYLTICVALQSLNN